MNTPRTVRTMCPMNCHPTLCGMLAEVEEGRLVGVSGDPENPDSQGFLCVRGHASKEVIDNPQRLLYPQVRQGRSGQSWRRASWDEVLERIAAQMEEVGHQRTALWSGHGTASTNYGTGIGTQYLRRFADLYGCQMWSGAMICWGLGGFGLGITGALETSTKEDMGAHAELILLWGANLASQPNTTRHLVAARRRGAKVVVIDVRRTEASRHADESLILRPGTDAALALALMQVLVGEGLYDREFVAAHTVGFDELQGHVGQYTPDWAAAITGIAADKIEALAREYAATRPAMILLGGSSLHKGANSWLASRAIGCLPALGGHLGVPGGGFGPRHGSSSHGQALNQIALPQRQPPGDYVPNQMAAILDALENGRVQALMLLGTNMLSSFADSGRLAAGLAKTKLLVSHDLFLNDTARRFADIVLPGTAWLEQLGCKSTNTHLYLMEPALEAPGETKPLSWILRQLADRLGLDDFFPWADEAGAIDAILDHPSTGHATVESLRQQGGIGALQISHVAHPDHRYATPSGKIEFYSARLRDLGLPPLPVHEMETVPPDYPLALTQGRTLAHFHSFYNSGQALPSLAKLESGPTLWLSPGDAAQRGVVEGGPIRVYNQRGALAAQARVTEEIPDGTVWMRDGWLGLNQLTDSTSVLPDAAVDLFGFTVGQSSYRAFVEVAPA
ncbi:MAG: molybdopterin-dependent oxidoreductase [Candidatus Latescibacteria bacterium]|nr:molybdopterin-dependent oxidoreductase [Candidatus Latescibacterota bacterium]